MSLIKIGKLNFIKAHTLQIVWPYSASCSLSVISRTANPRLRLLRDQFKNVKAEEVEKVALFLRMMAVCQTVVPEINDKGEIEYQASSPDEAALVKAASRPGSF